MSELTPVEHLTKIQKLKYRAAIFPILLVIISFVVNMTLGFEPIKYVSLIGLFWYVFIIMKFRIKRAYPSENKNKILISPVHGKIVKIEGNFITIKRGFFDAADLRFSGQELDVEFDTKRVIYFEEKPTTPGKLIGVILAPAICKISVTEGWKILVKAGDKISAGETVLVEKLT